VVSPVKAAPGSELAIAQPIAAESIRRARDFAREHVSLELLSAQLPEDRPAVPESFRPTPDLERCLETRDALGPRRLPHLREILERAWRATQAEFLVFSNADIGLMPHFYVAVARFLTQGYDALVINRRTLPDHFRHPSELPQIYCELGRPHPGFDCFVFRRELFPALELGSVCVGAPGVGGTFYAQLLVRSVALRLLDDHHLTFHLGDLKRWAQPAASPAAQANLRESERLLAALLLGCVDPAKADWLRARLRIIENELRQARTGLPESRGRLERLREIVIGWRSWFS
jgi:hypothetical protein